MSVTGEVAPRRSPTTGEGLDEVVAGGVDDGVDAGVGLGLGLGGSGGAGRRRSGVPRMLAARWPALAGAGILAFLAVPRLGRRPFWLDESFSVGATNDLVAAWRGTGGTMGLYYLVIWPVTQLTTSREWIRLPSLVFAIAAIFVVQEIGRRLGGRRMGAFAAAALSVMWGLSRFAIEARSYTLALLLVSLSWLGLVGAIQAEAAGLDRTDPSARRWWRLFVVATLLAPLAHGLAALHFVSQMILLAVAPTRRRWWRACLLVAVALAVEGAVLFGLGAGEVAAWIEPLNMRQVTSILRMLLGRAPRLEILGAVVLVAILLRVRAAARRGRSAPSWLDLVPVVWAVGVPLLIIAMSLVRPYAEPRYVIGAFPGIALLIGGLLARIRPQGLAVAAGAVLAVLMLFDQPEITSQGSEDWPALAERITLEARDGDRLLMPNMLRAPFDFAWVESDDRPDLVPLSPTNPMGTVLRFYDEPGGSLRDQMLADPTAPVWYVDRDYRRLDEVADLVADPEVAALYDVTGRWTFWGELYLIRFEPRPATPPLAAAPAAPAPAGAAGAAGAPGPAASLASAAPVGAVGAAGGGGAASAGVALVASGGPLGSAGAVGAVGAAGGGGSACAGGAAGACGLLAGAGGLAGVVPAGPAGAVGAGGAAGAGASAGASAGTVGPVGAVGSFGR